MTQFEVMCENFKALVVGCGLVTWTPTLGELRMPQVGDRVEIEWRIPTEGEVIEVDFKNRRRL